MSPSACGSLSPFVMSRHSQRRLFVLAGKGLEGGGFLPPYESTRACIVAVAPFLLPIARFALFLAGVGGSEKKYSSSRVGFASDDGDVS